MGSKDKVNLEKAFGIYIAISLFIFLVTIYQYGVNQKLLDEYKLKVDNYQDSANKYRGSTLDCLKESETLSRELDLKTMEVSDLQNQCRSLEKQQDTLEHAFNKLQTEEESCNEVLESYSNFSVFLASCEKIKIQDDRDECYISAVKESKGLSSFFLLFACDRIMNKSGKDYCYTWTGTEKDDLSICEKINPKSSFVVKTCCLRERYFYRDICFQGVAINTLNASLCEAISIQRDKDYCYFRIATGAQNSSLCVLIQNQTYRDGCISFFGVTS